jgi:DNA uptake protein ComE-like DNA-binding protein
MGWLTWWRSRIPGDGDLRRDREFQAARAKLLRSPHCRWESSYDIAAAADLGLEIDVNRASVDDWLRLPGMSIHQANQLTQLTQSGVQFNCAEDLSAALGIPLTRLTPWLPVLKFYFYDPESALMVPLVNVNGATVEQLAALPSIDRALAETIAQERGDRGPFRSLADLQRRLNLPGPLTADLMHYLRF